MSIDLPWYLEDSQARYYTDEYAKKLKSRRKEAEKQTKEAMVNNIDDDKEQSDQRSRSEGIYNVGYKYEMLDIPIKPFVGSLKDLMNRETQTFQTQMETGLKKSWMDQVLNDIRQTSWNTRIVVVLSLVGVGIIIVFHKLTRRKAFIELNHTNECLTKTKKKRKRKKKHQIVPIVTTEESSTLCTKIDTDISTELILDHDQPYHPKNILDVFSQDVPKMADIISKSGLSRQESIKIAAQEVFAIQRLQNEENRKREDERRSQLQTKAEASIRQIQQDLLSSMYGNRFLICLGISSVVRILISNLGCASRILWKKGQANVTQSLLHWIVSVLCGTFTTENKQCSFQNEMTIIPTRRSYFSFISVYYSGIDSIFPSAIIPSGSTACITSIVTYFVTMAFGHRLIRIFHSDALHRAWNILLILSFCLNTNLGQSLLLMVVQIFVFNTTLAASIYIRINQQMNRDKMDRDNLKIMESHHEKWIELSIQSSNSLKSMTMFVSLLLGFLPSILLWIKV